MWCRSAALGVNTYTDHGYLLLQDDTMCSDDPSTIIVKTDAVNGISDLQMNDDGTGSVLVEAGVTFPQL